jgi:hypothetical protein
MSFCNDLVNAVNAATINEIVDDVDFDAFYIQFEKANSCSKRAHKIVKVDQFDLRIGLLSDIAFRANYR